MTFLHGIPIFEINGMINRTAVIRRVGGTLSIASALQSKHPMDRPVMVIINTVIDA